MIVVGLVGGVGSGKSVVARCFEALGAEVIDADRLGHEALRRDDVREAVRARWGDAVFDGNGWIKRGELAKIVFDESPDGRRELLELERMTHPHISHAMIERLEFLRSRDRVMAVLDAPILLKAGWDRHCDHVVFVDCPLELREERVRSRGWDAAEIRRRESSQASNERKRLRADAVIDNSGSLESTRHQVLLLFKRWTHA